jgi:hypothetical protein
MYFIRKKQNKSGSTSIYIVNKTKSAQYKDTVKYDYRYETIGVGSNPKDIELYRQQAIEKIKIYKSATPCLFTDIDNF